MTDAGSPPEFEPDAQAARSGGWPRVGAVLLGLSLALWVLVPVVPFLALSMGAKATLAGALVVAAEIAFWLGALLAGPEAVRRSRSWIRNVLRKNRSPSP